MSAPQRLDSSIVDTVDGIVAMIDAMDTKALKASTKPGLLVDLEGVNLSRDGSVSIVEIFALAKNHVFLIDVHTLCSKAFTTCGSDKLSTLQSILESPDIRKAFFDVRNDSDALHAHFGVKLAAVDDIQLMELGARRGSKRLVAGLAKCIQQDCPLSVNDRQAWAKTKEDGGKLFKPDKGGKYEVFNERPLSNLLRQYCEQDVALLPILYDVYASRLSGHWAGKVQEAARERVANSQSTIYNGHGRHMALGPW